VKLQVTSRPMNLQVKQIEDQVSEVAKGGNKVKLQKWRQLEDKKQLEDQHWKHVKIKLQSLII
jgi:hypothetical protein